MTIYIPNRIRVGYQKRDDTLTKQLAYVIYYDNFGKLRKETSWESWRHKDIEPQEFDNVPTSGFILNKGHTRHSWSHFGGKTTRIRIYDPRGIEFEITAENLVGVLMHTDCSKREIAGDLVYAWCGTELMLLPCCSEEYAGAKKFSELQEKKFSAKELKEGHTYVTKSEEKVVYLGMLDWWTWVEHERTDGESYYRRQTVRKHKKSRKHIFVGTERSGWSYNYDKIGENYFKPLVPSAVLAAEVSDTPPDNFAFLVDDYLKKSEYSSQIDHFEVTMLDRHHHGRWTIDAHGNAVSWTEHYDDRYGWSASRASSKFRPQDVYAINDEYDLSQRRDILPTGDLVKVYKNGVRDGY